MTDNRDPPARSNPTRQLLGLALLLVSMYLCASSLRSTNVWVNLTFVAFMNLLPFCAIPSVLRLRGRSKLSAHLVLWPVLASSLLGLVALAIFNIPAVLANRQMSRELGAVQQGRYSVHLIWKETAGGALGPHGVALEQRMLIAPGLYVVNYLDYFPEAHEGNLTITGANQIAVHITATSRHQGTDQVYSLKPWVYF
jgi:hypothetical protein